MSLYEYGNLSVDIDFTDVDFLTNYENAYDVFQKECLKIPPTGKTSERLGHMINAYDKFFTAVLGQNAVEKMFQGKRSGEQHIDALNKLGDLAKKQGTDVSNSINQYRPQNRQQRRFEHNKPRR